jgi:protein-tyrosine phosphatase
VKEKTKSAPDSVWSLEKPHRRIALEGAPNFRDLGGYRTNSTRRLKWGCVFRSGHLALLTQNDQQTLINLGIRSICDFRSEQETKRQPNQLPHSADIQSLHLPIVSSVIEPTQAIARVMKGDISWFTPDFMIKSYLEKIDRFHGVWYLFFKTLSQASARPLVFHCTAGKDRTGVCAALILLSLGVSENQVIDDHALSNVYNADGIHKIELTLSKVGIDPNDLRDYITAPKSAITATIEHIHKQFGSTQNYLIQKAGVKPDWLDTLAQELTESQVA